MLNHRKCIATVGNEMDKRTNKFLSRTLSNEESEENAIMLKSSLTPSAVASKYSSSPIFERQ